MSGDFQDAYDKGLSTGVSGGSVDAFQVNGLTDEARVGYVLGFGESAFVSAPPDARYVLIGELAAKARVPLSHFQKYEAIDDDAWDSFVEGYEGS